MQKVLVAGSTGYVGKYVVQEFKKQGYWNLLKIVGGETLLNIMRT